MTAATSSYDELKREFEEMLAFFSKPDWYEMAKQRCHANAKAG